MGDSETLGITPNIVEVLKKLRSGALRSYRMSLAKLNVITLQGF